MKVIKNMNVKHYGMIIALVLIAGMFQLLTNGMLLQPLNITNLILQNAYIMILAIGMLFVIVTGNIDLSVGSVAGFTGAVSGVMMVQMNLPVGVAVLAGLGMGALAGGFHGFWIAYKGIPAFIVTLAGMLVFRGLTMVTLGGQTISPFPTGFGVMASGFLTSYFGNAGAYVVTFGVTGLISVAMVLLEWRERQTQRRHGMVPMGRWAFTFKMVFFLGLINGFGWMLAQHQGIPMVLILLGALIVVYHVVASRTITGRHVYAYGGNPKAAELSGLKTKQLVFWVYVNMGMLAALAGLVFAARLNAATPRAGTMFELDAIAACFIGGASAKGGVGKVMGVIIGALIMGILNNGMSIMGIGVDYQQAIKGLMLLAAVVLDVYTKNKHATT